MKNIKFIFFGLWIVSTSSCLGLFDKLSNSKNNSNNDLIMLGLASLNGSQKIDPDSGGIIQTPTMSLIIPMGALDGEETITYASAEVPQKKEATLPLQAAYTFGPANLQFNTAATLQICYDAKNIVARGLQEKTVEIQYMDPETGQYISMGGDVNLAAHCVSAPIYHFSTYILTAQILATGANAPTIGGASFFPGKLIEGLPATIRSSITPDWNSGAGVASVVFYYRTTGSGAAFKNLALQPDDQDSSGHFYAAKIPGSDIVAAGLEYYIEAHGTLNKSRLRPTTAPAVFDTRTGDIPDATTPLKFQQNISSMSAGFSRDITLRVKGNSAATWYPVIAETSSFAGGRGTVSRPSLLQVRYTAQLIGPSNLEATYGSLISAPISTQSPPLTIYPGMLDRIEILYNDVILPDPFIMDATDVKQLDAAGYDAFNNFMFIKPDFATSGAVGSFGGVIDYGKFTAANVLSITNGQIIATLGAFSVSYNVTINPIVIFCQFDTGLFDNTCVFN